MDHQNTPTGLNRRDMLKLSFASAGAVGIGLNSPVTGQLSQDSSDLTMSHGALAGNRRRPACLDIEWAKGTGLIWMAGETLFYENPRNRFMRFRREFDLSGTPQRAELRLFADTQYIAWLNGVEIGRGPGRSDPTWTLFDTYDVAPLLKPGRNTLAVLSLFQGFGTGGRHSIMQALLAHLEMEFSDGKLQHVVSDRSWKTSPADEFVRPSPRLHATLGCMEVQDLRLADPGWQAADYDDSGWAKSDYIKPDLVNTPWYHFSPETLPPRTLAPLPFPGAVRVANMDFTLPEVEELGAVRPKVTGDRAASLPLRLDGRSSAQVVTLDLGRSECGYFTCEVTGPAGATIDVLCGEALVDAQFPKPGSARIHTSRFILAGGRQTLRVHFNWLGFRYAQMWISTPEPLEIHAAVLQLMSTPLGPAGHFKCSDDFLNRLDAICEHTLRLCSKDGILDSSSREQQQWIGDGRFTAITLHQRFSAGVLHRRLIEQVGHGIDWLGTMVPRHPTGNLNVAPIPLYCLQWVLAFKDHAWFTGDDSLLSDWHPLIPHVLRWFTAFERADGLLEKVPHWMYIELGEEEAGRVPVVGVINTTLNLCYLAALRYGAQILAGEQRLAAEMEKRAVRLEAALRSVMWDESAGGYRDSILADGKFSSLSEGTNANALAYLEEPGSPRAKRILDSIFTQKAGNPIMASPFMMNVLLDALPRHGRADLVFPMLASRYPAQVESGSTWEHWRSHTGGGKTTPNAHSLSHAWGAAPLAFFINTVVGIRATAPGWKTVRISPNPGPLTRAEGSVETALGKISASWEIEHGTFRLRVELPKGVQGSCRLPDGTEARIPTGGGRFTSTMAE